MYHGENSAVCYNYNMNNETHKLFSTVDILSEIAELEHLRRHLLLAATVMEDEAFSYIVLAAECQTARRKIQKKYFGSVATKDWCIVKSAARLLQLMEETANGDLEETKTIKSIVDNAIALATGEDISNCEACHKDFEQMKI